MSDAAARAILVGICLVCVPLWTGSVAADDVAAHGEDVILLHGLGRTSRSMQAIEKRLTESGYRVHNIDYPSKAAPPEQLIPLLAEAFDECCASSERVHFVTHSLGGILTRAYFARSKPLNLGRVVMLAPPNRGSEVVDAFQDNRLFQAAFGPAVFDLGTGPDSLPNRLGPADFELGVIAGNRSFNPIGSSLIKGEDDGSVSVYSTQLEGMTDFVIIQGNHSFIMKSNAAVMEIVHFLKYGRFARSALMAQSAR